MPAGFVVVVVVVAGAHFASQPETQTANTAGLVGQSAMQAWREPPGQSSGVGDGDGDGAGAGVVVAVQSTSQTSMQASNAAPVTTAHAALHAAIEPPGH